MSFDFQNIQTDEILLMIQVPHRIWTEKCNWMPVIGSDRKALMLNPEVLANRALTQEESGLHRQYTTIMR